MIDAEELAVSQIKNHLEAKGVRNLSGQLAADLLHAAKSNGQTVDEICEWIAEQPAPISIHDFPRTRTIEPKRVVVPAGKPKQLTLARLLKTKPIGGAA